MIRIYIPLCHQTKCTTSSRVRTSRSSSRRNTGHYESILILDKRTKYSKQSLWCSNPSLETNFAPTSILHMKEIQVLSSDSEELANEKCFQSIDLYIQTESSEGRFGNILASHDIGKLYHVHLGCKLISRWSWSNLFIIAPFVVEKAAFEQIEHLSWQKLFFDALYVQYHLGSWKRERGAGNGYQWNLAIFELIGGIICHWSLDPKLFLWWYNELNLFKLIHLCKSTRMIQKKAVNGNVSQRILLLCRTRWQLFAGFPVRCEWTNGIREKGFLSTTCLVHLGLWKFCDSYRWY